MTTDAAQAGQRRSNPLAVVVDEVEWRIVNPGGRADEHRFGATGPSGRVTEGHVPGSGAETGGQRFADGLRQVASLTWVDLECGETFVFEMQPGSPARVAVSQLDGGIHVVPLPDDRCLAGLSDEELRDLVALARDRRRKADWAAEGGAVHRAEGRGPSG
ncbi:MAG: hypothetical protein HKO53_08355 [Gemmatimonadetes bacterium]|nr:hypothetical protein [Gemmatimonadota bacterium]